MAEITAAATQIDNEIAAVRSQIEALRHRRSLLSHSILASRKFNQQLERSRKESLLPRQALIAASEHAQAHANITITNLHRTCSGITAFRVQDPDPNAIDEGNVLGIRFDVFSVQKRAFQTPYYILLNQPQPDSDRLRIHKHTIPSFIPLSSLAARYLPQAADDNESPEKPPTQSLPRLVRALRRELVAHHKRVEVCEKLMRDLPGGQHGIKHVRKADSTGREIEILFASDIVARIRVATDGKIERAAVGPVKPVDGGNTLEEGPELYGRIRRSIEAGDRRIERLAERLKKRPRG